MKVLYTADIRDNQRVDSLFIAVSRVRIDHLNRAYGGVSTALVAVLTE